LGGRLVLALARADGCAPDSPLEQAGFAPSVPPDTTNFQEAAVCHLGLPHDFASTEEARGRREAGSNYAPQKRTPASKAKADINNADAFNRVLWEGTMGDKPYPRTRSGADLRQNRMELLKAAGFEVPALKRESVAENKSID
jgi:hypothetical protein